jgi:hypothetical protein
LFKARGKEAEQMTKGSSLRIRGCKVDMYHGSMRLSCAQDAEIDTIDDVKVKVRAHLQSGAQRCSMCRCRGICSVITSDMTGEWTDAMHTRSATDCCGICNFPATFLSWPSNASSSRNAALDIYALDRYSQKS